MSPGMKFRKALLEEKPLQIIGTVNAYVAKMAQQIGYRAIYLSGAGVANASYALPDLGITSLDNVLEDAGRITSAVDLPLLVDIDTGWGNEINIARTITLMERVGVAAVQIEDQEADKRCGHRPGKKIVSTEEMVSRIKAAVNAKSDKAFVVMARTDALANEGLQGTIERAIAYRNAGADMLFAEAIQTLDQYRMIKKAIGIPILANITEFGKTPLFTLKDLASVDVDMALYPLTVTRAMNKAAHLVLQEVRTKGTQKDLINQMQTRDELYQILDYLRYEKQLDKEETR